MFIKNRPNVLHRCLGADYILIGAKLHNCKKKPRNVYLKVGHYSTILVKVLLFFYIATHTVTSCVIKQLKIMSSYFPG